jgi:SAM-dependent methyltransferase
MTTVFGDVADVYDEARPGYPSEVAAAILGYHGGPPGRVVEIGAGTGKGTELLVGLGAPVTCVEPDPRMAELVRAKFPSVRVHLGRFEDWVPPPGGVPLVACAMAWHWLDPAARNALVHRALAPGGTLAVFGHRYAYADPAQSAALDAAFRSLDSTGPQRPDAWFHADIADSGLFSDLTVRLFQRQLLLSRTGYLRLVQTFSPFLRKTPEHQAAELATLGAAVDGFGGSVALDLRTSLVLARA